MSEGVERERGREGRAREKERECVSLMLSLPFPLIPSLVKSGDHIRIKGIIASLVSTFFLSINVLCGWEICKESVYTC